MWPFPKKRDFYKMLSDQSQKVEEGMESLYEYTVDPTREKAKVVSEIEKEADGLRRILIDELNHSFVTPIDREDIYALSRTIDDICDSAKSTVEEMVLFEVVPNDHIKKMAESLYNSSRDISSAVQFMRTHPQAANDHVVRTKKSENYMKHCYREALSELFKSKDVIHIMKLREIYRHLSSAAGKEDQAADIIGDILVKTT